MCAMTHHLCAMTHLHGWRDSFMRTSEVSAQSNVNILTKHPNHPGTCVCERDCESHCAYSQPWWGVLQCVAACCSVFQCVAVRRSMLQCIVAGYCNTLLHTATHCNTLQHTATHCNTLQQRIVAGWAASSEIVSHVVHVRVESYSDIDDIHIDSPWLIYNDCKYVTNGLCVSWCVHMCDMKTCSDIDDILTRHDSFITFVSVSQMVHVCRGVFICVIWRLVQILTTYWLPKTRHDSFITFISVSRMLYVCHDVFICVIWRIVQILTTHEFAKTRL